jgi:hypothetical protein
MRKPWVYLDRGKPGLRYQRGGGLILMQGEAPKVEQARKLTLEALRRHNSLEPELQDTHRLFLRWSEREGTGLSDPDADIREMHYDPLPLPLQERISVLVDSSPWNRLVRKLYAWTLDKRSLAEQLGVSKSQLYSDRRSALWYFRGRFEAEGIPLLASPARLRKSFDLW